MVARFRADPDAELEADGAALKISDLSITLESPAVAMEIVELLGRPETNSEGLGQLARAESAVTGFLKTREEAMRFFAWAKVSPREALLSKESELPFDTTKDPLDVVYSSYSTRLSESLDRMNLSLGEAETLLGPKAVERLYALAYTIGQVQNSLFEGQPDLAKEVGCLAELGVVATAQDLRDEKLAEELMLRAHKGLEAMIPSAS